MDTRVQPQLIPPSCSDRLLWDIWLSANYLPALTAADELGVFTGLAHEALTSEDLAKKLVVSSRAMDALLGLLSALGFLEKRSGYFSLTEVSRSFLLPESEFYWGGVLHTVKDMPISHHMVLEAMQRDSRVAKVPTNLKSFSDDWENHAMSSEAARSFTAKMHNHALPAALALSEQDCFSGIDSFLDIGGGSGCYSIALARRYPRTRFTVAELPAVHEITAEYIARFGLSDRITTLSMDMFRDPWPKGCDAIFFSDIFHDWEPHRCRQLVNSSFESLQPGGRLFVHEVLLNEDKVAPLTANSYSLSMLMVTRGQQFTATELEQMLISAGFGDVETIQTYGYYFLVTGRKP